MTEYFFDEEDSNDNIEVKDDTYNYKGYFVENGEEEEKKFINLELISLIIIYSKD